MNLYVNNITFNYKSRKVLEDINFKVGSNKIISILGPNGAGKTTLLRCINKILKPQSGSVFIDEIDISKLRLKDISKKLAYVSQNSTPGRLTAFDTILLGKCPHINWKISENDLRDVQAIISHLNLEKLSLQYVDEMSGGEYQKVCIARALVQHPEIILLDEPTSSLDLKNQQDILKLMKLVVETHDVSVIMSVHDINTALRYSDLIIFLKDNKIYSAVEPKEVTAEIIESVYDVKVNIHEFEDYHHITPI